MVELTIVGLTLRIAVFVTPPRVAEIVTLCVVATAVVLAENVVVIAPAGTVTFEDTLATEELLLSDTTVPPVGADCVSVTTPEAVAPPVTPEGLNETLARAA
ncbi:hypothetical protein CCAX7_007940 [Capsulimonas corticalis]|uniref:Uncharacterized protein n=1 Tax=Capsulimonas corticalis TaxID=2219043 RepID=A0A402CTT2_9BACT|nr:hypothetical protein CCAX7_007940 [Capsulimonas corticalis]